MLALVLAIAGAQKARADEGMWQPELLPAIADKLTARGLRMDPAALTDLTEHPMGAIIGLGFCTASFVSPDGLIVTNHHCAYGAIQYASTEDDNLLEKGFVARRLRDEQRGNPTLRVYVTESIEPVTEAVRADLSDALSGKARFDAIEAAKKRLVAKCEADPGHRCDVYTFYGGAEYRLIKQREIRDVRLVYAPPLSIGRYGGDVDNWVWPRHTGDFAFLRAYVAPDGKSRDFDEDNVPYRPDHYLRINPQGVNAEDFVMALGYPGATSRHSLASEVDYAVAVGYPNRLSNVERRLRVIEEQTADRPDAALKYASAVATLNNGRKNFQGMLDGFAAADVPAAKRAVERTVARDPAAAEALERLRSALDDWFQEREARRRYDAVVRQGLLGAARTLYRAAIEAERPDAQRKPGFQERDRSRLEDQQRQLERRLDPSVDQALLALQLEEYASLGADERIDALDAWFGLQGQSPDLSSARATLDQMYARTELADTEQRLAWLQAEPETFRQSEDPFIRLAVALSETDLRLEAEEEAREGDIEQYRAAFMGARLAGSESRPLYDDANNSLRVTYGSVTGYSPRDAVELQPFTTLEGITEKDTGAEPFNAPDLQLRAIARRAGSDYASEDLDSVPVNFLSSLDVTGGNSGSPTLDGEGRLVGLVFDGNYESINADWWFSDRLTRTIHVDIRYMLWVMDVVSEARELMQELGVR